jgi:O-methyltransferase
MPLFKETFKRLAALCGFEIFRIPKSVSKTSLEYEVVRPSANYSPWNKDRQFQAALASIQGFTLVDKYRCFELWKLVEQSAKLEKGSIIEIGVWRGGTGALIATQARNCGIQEKVYLCDTFAGVVKAGAEDAAYKGGEHADTSRRTVEELIAGPMKLSNVEILEGIFPEQTGRRIDKMKFRFCHVDVDVYQSAKDIVDWIWDKLVPGGIIVFDDYGFNTCNGITNYVDEQMLRKDRLIVCNLNGHAIIIKR